ncbi:MAG: MmgE/PrpD, partial [Sphingomonas sp.]|nr:MmgE/PrpD [Sphingomonas sp.]
PYPSGRASHAVLAGIANLGLRAPDVKALTMFVPPLVARLIGRPFRSDMSFAYARLCAPLLGALMLRDGAIDPRAFTVETFADAEIAALASRIEIEKDSNEDPNALSPQRLLVELSDGFIELEVPHTLGSPAAPLSTAQAAAKLDLARALAPGADPLLFDAPLAWFTEPA